MTRFFRITLALICSLPVTAGSFNFSSFSSATIGLNVEGSASLSAQTPALQLTPNAGGEAGAVWYGTQENIASGFTTTFSYTITCGGTGSPSPCADGIAFVIQDDSGTALGGGGSQLGIGSDGITNSVAVALRTYGYNDVEVDACGASNQQVIGSCVVGSQSETLGGTNTVTIDYTPGTLLVYLNGSQILDLSVNLATDIGASSAWVGLTGGTGADWESQVINSWSFTTVPEPATLLLVGIALPAIMLRRRLSRRR